MTIQAPPSNNPSPTAEGMSGNSLPDTPSQARYPVALPISAPDDTTRVTWEARTQSGHNGVYSLDQDVVITMKDRVVRADHIDYDSNTGDVIASGHLVIVGGNNKERLSAAHGTYNLRTSTGTFYDVSGSVAMKPPVVHAPTLVPSDPTYSNASRVIYTSGNPFLFTGRLVVKTGPSNYDIYDGSVTSCQLPRPDWLLSSAHFQMDGDKARATGSTFRLLGVPLLYLPYVTHPVDANERQSGFLIPTIGQSSTKGFILGEQIYFAINRSADLTVGADYYSSRGYAQMATFRYRGQGLDFVNVRYTGLLDKLVGTANQGGEDLTFAGRRDFSPSTRAAANVEYLSSYIYREAFTENFNQAVTSDVVSTAYLSHNHNGFELAGLADRYQGIKLIAQGDTPEQQVRIFHVPTLSFSATDHHLGTSSLEYSFDSSVSGLKRAQPNFASGGIVERFDFHPQLALPFSLGLWRFRPAVGTRETLYSRSRVTPYVPGEPPIENLGGLTRVDGEVEFDIRPPVIERTFTPDGFTKLLGTQVRHTIEPELTYRYTGGVDNFLKVLRFDETDIVSDRNELEYGVTQRLFRRVASGSTPCQVNELPQGPGLEPEAAAEPVSADTAGKGCGNEELISWRLTQKYFFDPTFGNAVINGRRNIFDSTLDLSGVAFLTEPRNISPLISRMRIRTTAKSDIEWDFDLDTGAKKFTSDNVFLDLHQGNAFGALSYARLDAPGRFYTANVSSTVSSFNQMRILLGYGQPAKPGLSLAGNAGFDLCPASATSSTTTSGTTATPSASCTLLQYAAVQTSYNWNCCGLAVEYRKYELGAVRNEGVYRFNFTLANIGAAGNLRRAERLF